MSKDIIHSKSINELLNGMLLENPIHPLITIIDTEKSACGVKTIGKRFSSDLF